VGAFVGAFVGDSVVAFEGTFVGVVGGAADAGAADAGATEVGIPVVGAADVTVGASEVGTAVGTAVGYKGWQR
jgi:hypothetical protein